MANFDSAFESMKRGFDKAAAKTGEVIGSSKLAVEKSQIKTRINSLYTRLGRAYYLSLQGNTEEQALIEKILARLEGAMSDLEDVEVLIASTKSIKCPICGRKNSASNDFCTECGMSLYDDEQDQF